MKVVIDGMAWLPANELKEHQRANLRNALTIHPSKTFDAPGKKAPQPIELYIEKNDLFGVPRAFYERVRKGDCLLYTSPSPRDKRQSRMPSSA